MTAPTDTEPETLAAGTATTDQTMPTESAAEQQSDTETKRPKSRRLKSGDSLTLGDLRAGLTGEKPAVTVDPTSTATTTPATEKKETSNSGLLTWLADASHWLPLDEDAVDIPSIVDLTDEHRARVNRSSALAVQWSGKATAAITLFAGYALNIASLAVATVSTALDRAFVTTEEWNAEGGFRMRPRSLAALSVYNARRAAKIKNRFLRAHFVFAAGVARRISGILNPIAHDIAWVAAGINSPRRVADAATVLATTAALITGIWWMAG